MKKALLFLLLIFSSASIFAQEEKYQPSPKPTVFFAETSNGNIDKTKAAALRNAIIAAITKTNRIIAIDAESEDIAANEDIRRTKSNVTAGDDCFTDRMGAVVKLGAQFYLTIKIDHISFSHSQDMFSKKDYAVCTVTGTLKLIDPAQSKILQTKQIEFMETSPDNNENKAYDNVLASIDNKPGFMATSQNPVFQTVEEFFPIIGQIIEINEAKKNKAITVYINAGNNNGVNNDTRFEVLAEKKIGTRLSFTHIGEIKVSEVQGDDLTLCKVTDEGDKIFTAFNEGTVLKVKSRRKKGRLGDILK